MEINWVEIVVTSAITTPAVGGLLGWLGKRILARETAKHNQELETLKAHLSLQVEAYKNDLDRSKQLLQAEIDKTILVTRAHFETEFSSLKDVYAKLAEVRILFAGLRPIFGTSPQNDTEEAKRQRLAARFTEFLTAYNALIVTFENLKPFYPEAVFNCIELCRAEANREILQLQTSGDRMFDPEWFEQGDKNLGQFLDYYNAVTKLIRQRISQLAIIKTG